MIWGEESIRERVRIGVGAARGDTTSLSFHEAESLIDEIDRLRGALEKVKTRAWGNHLVRKIADEALK